MNARRPIRSPYSREARTVRRPRDNRRPHKRKAKTMYLNDKQLFLLIFFLAGIWMLAIAYMAWLALQ